MTTALSLPEKQKLQSLEITIRPFTPTPPKTPSSEWQDLERSYGLPMREILLEEYMTHGNFGAIGRELGISKRTVADWWARCALPERGNRANGDDTFTIVICGEVE